jgi:tetratricopeptide (TPR) repeat protein
MRRKKELKGYFGATAFLLGLFLVGGCVLIPYYRYYDNAQKAYKANDFDTATLELVKSLKENPKFEDAALLLRTVAPLAYEKHEKKVEELENRQDWEGALVEYDIIQGLVEKVKSLGGDYPVVDVSGRRTKALENAAEVHYSKGASLLQSERFLEAETEFKRSLDFVPNYKDARALAEQARNQANLKAAEEHYSKGTSLLKEERFFEAADEFNASLKFVPKYKDAEALAMQAKEKGNLKAAEEHYQ